MSERSLQKQLLLERVRSNRAVVRLEVAAMRTKVDSVLGFVRVGRDLIQPLAALAASAAAGLGAKRGKSAIGLAALVPVVLTVAKLVAAWQSRRDTTASKPAGAEADEPEPDDENAG